MTDRLPPEMAAAIGDSFATQVAFFRAKLGHLVPTAKWDDLWQSAHDRAFMVAGAARADLLADLAAAVDRAIADGETLQAFRQRFAEIVERHGWHGWTGEATAKGRAWRTRVIYETNLITSYAAGRLAQLQEGGYEWWVYKHSDFVKRPRPHHVALDGTTKRADDPFWQTYSPPNGWGCFPGGQTLRANALLGYRFAYRGKLVELHTRGGRRLAVTPNHPVLTRRGWIAAGNVQAGDELLAAGIDVDAGLGGIVDDEQPPARVEDLFEALAAQGFRIAPMTAHDFDGDAAGGEDEVEIAGADAALMDELELARHEPLGERCLDDALVLTAETADDALGAAQQALVHADAVFAQDAADGGLGNAKSARDGSLADEPGAIHRDDLALDLLVAGVGDRPGAAHQALAPIVAGALIDPARAHPFGAVADGNAAPAQDAMQRRTADAQLFTELLEAYAGKIAADEVVLVRELDWSGHVFDFTTDNGLILAGGLVVSNCRCRIVGARGPASIRRLGGDPDKPMPAWVGRIDPKTGAPVGVDKGFAYQPGATVADAIRGAVAKKTVHWPYEMAKAYMGEVPPQYRDLLARSIRSQPETGEAARRFAERAIGARNGARIDAPLALQYQTLGLLTQAEARSIAALSGVDDVQSSLYDWAIDASTVRKVQKDHSDDGAEARRGQSAVTTEDYALLPTIIAQADRIEEAGVSDVGRPVVRVIKRIGDLEYVAAFEVRAKRKMIALQSMWKRGRPPALRP